jgi:DNA invertase Pin-like site-specific DNA recombinase
VSSGSADQINSFISQNGYYTNLICGNPGYEFAGVYADEGVTGTSRGKRDEFLRLIQDCRKGLIDVIYTKTVTRFARNTLESLETVRELRTCGVTVIFENDGFSTETMTDELLMTVLSAKAQAESESISGNMRWSYKKRMKKGEFITCKAPFGYRLANGKYLTVHEGEAETVRYIFSRYLDGVSVNDIAKTLTGRGIRKKYGAPEWRPQHINTILQSERYAGDALIQKTCSTEEFPFQKVRNTGQKDQYYLRNSHPAIVSRDIFDRTQTLMQSRRTHQPPRRAYPLTKRIVCGECGTGFRRKVVNGNTKWVCDRHDRQSACGMKPIPEAAICAAFVRLYHKLKRDLDTVLIPLLTDLTELKNKANGGNARIGELNRQLADLAQQNWVLKDVQSKGFLNSDIFLRQSNEIMAQISALKHEKSLLTKYDEDDEVIAATQEIIGILQDGAEVITAFDVGLFNDLVEKIIVESKEQIRFQLRNGLRLTERIG